MTLDIIDNIRQEYVMLYTQHFIKHIMLIINITYQHYSTFYIIVNVVASTFNIFTDSRR